MRQDIFSYFTEQPDGSFLPKENSSSYKKLLKVGSNTWKYTKETDKIIIEELFERKQSKMIIIGRVITEKETNISITISYDIFQRPIVISSNTKPINIPQRYNEPLSFSEINQSFTIFKSEEDEYEKIELWKKDDKEEMVCVVFDKDNSNSHTMTFRIAHNYEEKAEETIERFEVYDYAPDVNTKPYEENILTITKSKNSITYKRFVSTLDENKKYAITNCATYSFNSDTGEIGDLIKITPLELIILYHSENVELEEVFETNNLKNLERKSYSVKIKLQDGSYRHIFGDIDEGDTYYRPHEISYKFPDNSTTLGSLQEIADFNKHLSELFSGKDYF